MKAATSYLLFTKKTIYKPCCNKNLLNTSVSDKSSKLFRVIINSILCSFLSTKTSLSRFFSLQRKQWQKSWPTFSWKTFFLSRKQ